VIASQQSHTATNAIVTRIRVGTYPYTTVVSADGAKVYVSNWGGDPPKEGEPKALSSGTPVRIDPKSGIVARSCFQNSPLGAPNEKHQHVSQF
jgi:DNA-binding beta-propeller fold protein YncE